MKNSLLFLSCCLAAFVVLLSLGFSACGTKSGDKPCSLTAPIALLSDTMKQVTAHQFNRQGMESTETALLFDSIRVSIQQSGCDKIKQEFSFQLAGDFKDPELDQPQNWAALAPEMMYMLAAVDPSLMLFRDWGDAMEKQLLKQTQIKALGEDIPLSDGIFFRLSREIKPQFGVLTIVLFQQ